MNINDILEYPILTEKTYATMDRNVYVFRVNKNATKIDVRNAIEFIFRVKVAKINMIRVPKQPTNLGRYHGYTNEYKKAYIYLKEGKINIFPEEKETKTKKSPSKEILEKNKSVEDKVAQKIRTKTKNKDKE